MPTTDHLVPLATAAASLKMTLMDFETLLTDRGVHIISLGGDDYLLRDNLTVLTPTSLRQRRTTRRLPITRFQQRKS